MRSISIFILTLITFCTYSQTNNELAGSKEIAIFFSQLNTSELKIKKIDQKIKRWTENDIYGEKDTIFKLGSWASGILKNETVLKYFSKDDIAYIEKQYLSNKDSLWNKNDFKNFELLDSLGLNKIMKQSMKRKKMRSNYSYSFSIPLFSIDKKYVIITQDFYCGFMCSSQCIYIYQRNNIFGWKVIASWNCWST